MEQKLKVLADIACVFNEQNILWAVGASALLYFHGKTNFFDDLDLMVSEADVEKAKAALLNMGTLTPPKPDKQYKTRHFLEFVIDGVDVDIMAGLVIVKDDEDFDCSLFAHQIESFATLYGQTIPLQSLHIWRRYYQLMGRVSKVQMIDR